jgi:hypothetical protein
MSTFRHREREGNVTISGVMTVDRRCDYTRYWKFVGQTEWILEDPQPEPYVTHTSEDYTNTDHPTEEMDDTIGGSMDKPCVHQKRTPQHTGPFLYSNSWSEDSYWTTYPYDHWEHQEWTDNRIFKDAFAFPGTPFGAFSIASYESQLADLVEQHLTRCLFPISTSVSIANFIYELKDIKHLIKLLDPSGLRKKIEGGIFSWEFGIKPFLSDLDDIRKSISRLDKQLRWLIRNDCKPVRIMTKRKIATITEAPEGWVDDSVPTENPGKTQETRFSFKGGEVEAWLVSWIEYDLSDISDLKLNLLAASKVFGLSNIPKIIWNMIPFSFVLDWLININRMLDRLDLTRASIPSKITRSTTHLRGTVEYSAKTYMYAWITSQFFPWLAMEESGSCKCVTYERALGLPDGGFAALDPTARQQLLGLLLADQHYHDRLSRNTSWKSFRRIGRKVGRWLRGHPMR